MRPGKSVISLISFALFVFVSSATPTPTPMVPSMVQGVTVTRTVQDSSPALRVSWNAVSGSGITYRICYVDVNTESDPSFKCKEGITDTSTTLGPLSPGTTYRIWIVAVGQSHFSYGRLHRTYKVPSAPANITALPSTTTLTVIWDDEEFSYRLHVQKKGSTEINTFGPVTPPYNITGLESNTEYTVVVEAYNPLGSANGSVVGYTLPEATPTPTPTPTLMLPSLVQGITVTRTVSPALRVSWSVVNGSGITYTVCYINVNSGPSCEYAEGINGTSTTLSPLSPGTTYRIWVRAESSAVLGHFNYGRLHRTFQVPSAPANITALPSTTTLTVRWDDEEFSYRLHVQKKGSTEINTFGPVTPPYNITGLESNTEYTVVVEAYNPLGSAIRIVVGYTLPEVEDIKTNGLDANSHASSNGLSAGLFIAGLFSGVIAVLLVEGIILGVCKIRTNQKLVKLSEEGMNTIQMTDCPAYVSNDRGDKSTGENTYEEVYLGELKSSKTE